MREIKDYGMSWLKDKSSSSLMNAASKKKKGGNLSELFFLVAEFLTLKFTSEFFA